VFKEYSMFNRMHGFFILILRSLRALRDPQHILKSPQDPQVYILERKLN